MTEIMLATFYRVTTPGARFGKLLVQRSRQRRMQIERAFADFTTLVEVLVHRGHETGSHILKSDTILRPLRSGERRLDAREIELEHVGENRVGRALGVE